jgi:putative colanic acid biosynthesis glycosyltransferase
LELSELYNCANIFLNPTYEDNFPTTNLEAMACGTPVVTYNTGGSPESITTKTGFVVDQGNIPMMIDVIEKVATMNRTMFKKECRSNVENNYEMNNQFLKYFDLYESVLNN